MLSKTTWWKLGHWGNLSAQDFQKEVESATTMLYKWLLNAKSCAVAPSKRTITWKKCILPGTTMKNLLSMARGFAVNLHLLVNVLCRQRKWETGLLWAYVVREATDNFTKGHFITEGITSGRRFLKRPGVEAGPMPQLDTWKTSGLKLPPRRRTRANENA